MGLYRDNRKENGNYHVGFRVPTALDGVTGTITAGKRKPCTQSKFSTSRLQTLSCS